MLLFSKMYDGESLVDMARDTHEALDERFNDKVIGIPQDEVTGIMRGTFKVTIEWSQE